MSLRMLSLFGLALATAFVTDLVWRSPLGQSQGGWSATPGIFALGALVSCVVLIVIPKWLGSRWLQRRRDYYDQSEVDA